MLRRDRRESTHSPPLITTSRRSRLRTPLPNEQSNGDALDAITDYNTNNVLSTDHANAPDWQLTAQDAFNNTFALIFVVESCLMLYGLGLRCYFSTGRQTFEFVVTVASLIDLTMDLSGACSG